MSLLALVRAGRRDAALAMWEGLLRTASRRLLVFVIRAQRARILQLQQEATELRDDLERLSRGDMTW